MYSCLTQVHVSRNPSARSRMSPLPHLPKISLNNNLPQVHVSRNPSARSQMSSLTHLPKVGGAFPGSVSPGVHLCHLSGLPSPLPQSQQCLPRISVSRNPLMSPQVNSLPHFPKVSGILAVRRIMYPGILPSTAGYLPFPTYPRSASTACILALLRFMYPGIHPLAPDVSPPTYPRSASTTTFLKFMYPGIHPLAPDVFPSPFP
nr:uncharacterized protein LOC128705910 [Cherax quadricarinatus]